MTDLDTINFCDICGGSVPNSELLSGASRYIGVKLVCSACREEFLSVRVSVQTPQEWPERQAPRAPRAPAVQQVIVQANEESLAGGIMKASAAFLFVVLGVVIGLPTLVVFLLFWACSSGS